NGGTLNISADANLGAASSGLTLDGGSLQFGSDLSSGRAVTLGAGGGTFDTFGSNVSLTGPIAGSGALAKAGAGLLTLVGGNAYTGGTTISGGTLIASAAGLGSGAIVNDAALVLDEAGAGTLVQGI